MANASSSACNPHLTPILCAAATLLQPLRKEGQQAQLAMLELCCGAGGLSFLAHHLTDWARVVPRWAVDYDFDCCVTYKLHHPGARVDWSGLEPFLLLCRAWPLLREEVGGGGAGPCPGLGLGCGQFKPSPIIVHRQDG